jgi:hypothetical protein
MWSSILGEIMVKWIGILLISPLWGIVSTQLFLQSWLSFVNLVIDVLGFVRAAVSRKDTTLFMAVALFQTALFSFLL